MIFPTAVRFSFLPIALAVALMSAVASAHADADTAAVRHSVVGAGWANNSVNTVVFRKNSLATHNGVQYVAYYDNTGHVVLGKRNSAASTWTTQRTQYKGNVADAHNAISIMVDGAGYLHIAWDHHNHPLRYARSDAPGSLTLGEKRSMTGQDERAVSYPEFYRLPNGNLLFFYRNGASGNGNLVINRYDVASASWERLQSNLISGEGQRNAYWQAFLDHRGTLHVSWVWRESPDVASNHDMAYARSRDGGVTWENARGAPYALPITAASAEYALRIPQRSELINQTSMSAVRHGNPFIASYWREQGAEVPQYHVIWHTGAAWESLNLDFRKTAFSLSGVGTKRIPIARPQIMVSTSEAVPTGLMVFRDEERGNKVSVVTIRDFKRGVWSVSDLDNAALGSWEPSYDTELWRTSGILSLFVQSVDQVDGEGKTDVAPRPVTVLDWTPAIAR